MVRVVRHIKLLVLMLGLWLGIGPQLPAQDDPVRLTIFHTNDVHGYAFPQPATWLGMNPAPHAGGFATLAYVLEEERARRSWETLFLDAGDILTGHPASMLEHQGARGGYLLEAYNLLGLDAMAVGNHEFDEGPDNLGALLQQARFPILSCNLIDDRSDPPALSFQPYTVIERGGLRIGIIGVTTPRLHHVAQKANVDGFTVVDPAQVVQSLIDELDPQTDLIVLLTHQGVDYDVILASQITGADIIIGGDSHTRLTTPLVENGLIICQAGSRLTDLGVLDVTVQNDEVVTFGGQLITLWVRGEGLDGLPEGLADVLRQARNQLKELLGEELAVLKRPWARSYYQESNVGGWLAGAMRTQAQADIGLLNSGGIRVDLPAGLITKGDLLRVLPFRNPMCVFEATAEQIRTLCRHNAWASATEDHGILQLDGLSYRWMRIGGEDVVEVFDIKVGGGPLDPDRTYRIATNSFIAIDQPEKYLGFTPVATEQLPTTVSEAVLRLLREVDEVDAQVEQRMEEVEKKPLGVGG